MTQNLHNVISTKTNIIAATESIPGPIEELDAQHPGHGTTTVDETYADHDVRSIVDRSQLEHDIPSSVSDKRNESNASTINPLIFDVTAEDIQSTKNDVSLSDIESFYDTGVRSENALNNSDDIPFISCLQQSTEDDANLLVIEKQLVNDYQNVCRLCAQVFHESEESIHLFNDESSDDYEDLPISYIEQLMPNIVSGTFSNGG